MRWMVSLLAAGLLAGCAVMQSEQAPVVWEEEQTLAPSTEGGDAQGNIQQDTESMPSPAAALDMAVALITQTEYARAAAILEERMDEFESSDDPRLAAEGWFWLGYCREKQGKFDEARDNYMRVVELYPHGRAADQAKQRLVALRPR